MDTNFWEYLVWGFWIFVWLAAIFVWVRCISDLFSDPSQSGWAKAGWTVLLVLLPWLGALIYLVARGSGMGQRSMARAAEAHATQERYIREAAAKSPGSGSAADEIAAAKALLDSGAVTQEEFDAMKARALN